MRTRWASWSLSSADGRMTVICSGTAHILPVASNRMRAIQITEFGGPEVLRVTELPDPVPGAGQSLVEVTSAGVNYADTHQVENSYLSATTLPTIPGSEVVGTFEDGTRVAAFTMSGGYCEKALVHPHMAFPLPDDVSDGQALSLMVQGLTAWHLL